MCWIACLGDVKTKELYQLYHRAYAIAVHAQEGQRDKAGRFIVRHHRGYKCDS